jgi:hypothetical protein
MRSRSPVIHPILFAIFPILSLYLSNSDQIRVSETFSSLVLVLCTSLLLWAGLNRWLKDTAAAGIIVSTGLLLFFSFAHLLLVVQMVGYQLGFYDFARKLVRDQVYLLVWMVVELLGLGIVSLWVWRSRKHLDAINRFLNFFGLTLIIVTLATWIIPPIQNSSLQKTTSSLRQQNNSSPAPIEQKLTASGNSLPDIYYIILDGYGRSDVLQTMYHIDNQDFLNFLESKGFYIANQAFANYALTAHSLACSLNFTYLDTLVDLSKLNTNRKLFLLNLVENNRTFRSLHDLGYKNVVFTNGYTFTSKQSADIRLGPPVQLSSFQNVLINNTPLMVFLQKKQYDQHRDRILYTLEHLPEMDEIAGPKFIVAHIVAPHPPFVFGAQGEPLYPPRKFGIDDASDFMMLGTLQEYTAGYSAQLIYISNRVRTIIDQILSRSDQPPIIIIQGDHGPRSQMDLEDADNTNYHESFPILNAYYFPGVDATPFYPEISPVNTFRVLFNTYFGTHYPLLEEHSYITTSRDIFNFIEVTGSLKNWSATSP